MAMASRRAGIAISPSMTRIRIASSDAEEAGDEAERQADGDADERDAEPTISETRAP